MLCGLTTGLLVLLFIALDPQLAGGLGEAFINLTYGEYPRWLPVAAISVILFVAALLALLFAFRKDRHDFENMLAAWLAKIWVEVKLLVIVAVVLVAILLDFGTTLGGMITPVVAVVFLYFLCLDIGKNRQFFRHNIVHSLLKALNSYRDLTGFEQRSLRRLLSTLAVIVGVLGVSAATFLSLLRVAHQFMHDILKQHGVDGIKAGKGFIQDDKIRVGDQRGNELDFLLVALAQRIQLFVFIRAHLQALQPVVHGGQRCFFGRAPQLSQVQKLFRDYLFRVESAFLGEIAKIDPLAANRLTVDKNFAGVRRKNAHNNADCSGFAGAVAAQKPQCFSTLCL